MRPLEGVRVLDFSTLLPGPLATLLLAEAGADVIKIERPAGDELRAYTPRVGGDSVNFPLLNRGKRSLAIDLKTPGAIERLRPLLLSADVVVDQFRPGVMERLGLGFDQLSLLNPKLICCSITGYGQSGPASGVAGHDLNYIAETGLLNLSVDSRGSPTLPPALIADIGGGAYPAVMNILLALRQRDLTGKGCRLDIGMTDNLFTLMYWALGEGWGAEVWPKPSAGLVTGASPRYQVYPTADGRHMAVAPIEDRFWDIFCDTVGLEDRYRSADADPQETRDAIERKMLTRTSDEWMRLFEGRDVCCSVVATLEEAVANPHFNSRRLFEHRVATDEGAMPALPVPVVHVFRGSDLVKPYPRLGEHNEELMPD
jgi:crotonobetainyl-CoA:carnitine CoA-transferase CaiB-like acyl-CoA transferase